MKKNNTLWLLLLALSSLFAACKKDEPQDEVSKLPPATQTGANTFGCLVNGKAWIAQSDCRFLCDASFKIYYDPSGGGSLSLIAINENSKNNIKEQIIVSFDSTNHKSTLKYQNKPEHMKFSYTNYINVNNCSGVSSIDSLIITSGEVTLTRYDLSNGIVSGSFNFSLSKINCPTIHVTNGRFDYNF